MPELPEVETIRRHLAPFLVGRTIRNVHIYRRDVIGFPDSGRFQSELAGVRIKGVSRRGKYLIFDLTRDRSLIVHLRLSGHLRLSNKDKRLEYERVRFILSHNKVLSFVDPRVLGRIYLVKDKVFPSVLNGLVRMGLEPIEKGFTAGYLGEKLKGRRAKVKSLLLDQRVCAGVGNIYADEALFRARVKPTRLAGELKKNEIIRLAQTLRRVLKEGIHYLGTTISDERYLMPNGGKGEFQNRLMVVGRKGEPCRICGVKIRRTKIGNRSSYYCPCCQN